MFFEIITIWGGYRSINRGDLFSFRELLSILTEAELMTLERALCSQEEPSFLISLEEKKKAAKEERRKSKEEKKKKKDKKLDSEGDDGSVESELTALEIAERLEALALNFETSRNTNVSTSNQTEPDSQSKSSETSSGSTSSILSGGSREAESSDAQLQHFTDQLYYEANLDSQNIHDEALARPLNAFAQDRESLPNIPPLDMPLSSSSSTLQASIEDRGSPQMLQASHKDVDKEESAEDNSNLETLALAMVKCNSNDSGLHSEVVSNSGSMFTISSSDSNHLMTSPDTPTSPQSFSQLQEFHQQDFSPVESHEGTDANESKGAAAIIVT